MAPTMAPLLFQMAIVWKVETSYCASSPEHPQQCPSSTPLGGTKAFAPGSGHSSSQAGFASISSSLLGGGRARVCRAGGRPESLLGEGVGGSSCCPQRVPLWPASGLGLSGGPPSGEKPRQEEAAS